MKLNIKNILLLIVLVILKIRVIADLITLATSLAQYTWFGIVTLILALQVISSILDYFEQYIK